MMILDIDHFKKFNDTHGHLAGDAVLQHVGKVLTKVVRETDMSCRYGGEEFAVVISELPMSTTTSSFSASVIRSISISTDARPRVTFAGAAPIFLRIGQPRFFFRKISPSLELALSGLRATDPRCAPIPTLL